MSLFTLILINTWDGLYDRVLREDETVLSTKIIKICDDVLKIVSEELVLKDNFYESFEAYMDYKNTHLEIFEKELKVFSVIVER